MVIRNMGHTSNSWGVRLSAVTIARLQMAECRGHLGLISVVASISSILTIFIEVSDQVIEGVGHDLSVGTPLLDAFFIILDVLLVFPVAVVCIHGFGMQSGILLGGLPQG